MGIVHIILDLILCNFSYDFLINHNYIVQLQHNKRGKAKRDNNKNEQSQVPFPPVVADDLISLVDEIIDSSDWNAEVSSGDIHSFTNIQYFVLKRKSFSMCNRSCNILYVKKTPVENLKEIQPKAINEDLESASS